MADRTHVTLTVMNEHVDKLKRIMSVKNENFDEVDQNDEYHYFTFNGVNYGELSFLEDLLKEGIPYDVRWGQGSEYSSGKEQSRYDRAGVPTSKTFYDCDINPEIKSLMEYINDYASLKRFILYHDEQATPLTWNDQTQNSKMYLLRRVLNLKEHYD